MVKKRQLVKPDYKLNPGSELAEAKGCTCPVMDNFHGRGFPSGESVVWWINADCPIHSKGDVGGKND